MAHTEQEKEKILQKAIKVAKDKKLFFMHYVSAYLPISSKTFYVWKCHESQELKDILEENTILKKTKMLTKWEDTNNATLQIALFKLLATEEEREILADNRTIKLEDMPEIKISVKE